MGFFIINLKSYAKCCNNSNNPTKLGPFLQFKLITLHYHMYT
jgi:hypothetical protein